MFTSANEEEEKLREIEAETKEEEEARWNRCLIAAELRYLERATLPQLVAYYLIGSDYEFMVPSLFNRALTLELMRKEER